MNLTSPNRRNAMASTAENKGIATIKTQPEDYFNNQHHGTVIVQNFQHETLDENNNNHIDTFSGITTDKNNNNNETNDFITTDIKDTKKISNLHHEQLVSSTTSNVDEKNNFQEKQDIENNNNNVSSLFCKTIENENKHNQKKRLVKREVASPISNKNDQQQHNRPESKLNHFEESTQSQPVSNGVPVINLTDKYIRNQPYSSFNKLPTNQVALFNQFPSALNPGFTNLQPQPPLDNKTAKYLGMHFLNHFNKLGFRSDLKYLLIFDQYCMDLSRNFSTSETHLKQLL